MFAKGSWWGVGYRWGVIIGRCTRVFEGFLADIYMRVQRALTEHRDRIHFRRVYHCWREPRAGLCIGFSILISVGKDHRKERCNGLNTFVMFFVYSCLKALCTECIALVRSLQRVIQCSRQVGR